MSEIDEIAKRNLKRWKRAVSEGDRCTQPWLNLDKDVITAYAKGDIDVLPEPYKCIYPNSIFKDVEGKEVLCLASGGGQQSAMFGILGAHVTVLDLTEEQLEGDRKAAEHYGYKVTTVQGDMRDLKVFKDNSFDLVYQPVSINFVPDVRKVYREVVRVLRKGGLYSVEYGNPAFSLIEEESWDGKGYRLSHPYKRGRIEQDEKWGEEFTHFFSDIFNGLVEEGFMIQEVWEDPHSTYHDVNAKPGTYDHMLTYVPMYFVVLARKIK